MLMRTRQIISHGAIELRALLLVALLFLLAALFGGCSDDSGPPPALYGPPPPNDAGVDGKPLVKDARLDGLPAKDVRPGEPCAPVALYGPQACASDSDCVTQYGAGWYCDKNNAVNDGCGHQSFWPVCKSTPVKDAGPAVPDGCMPATLYGPKPCLSDSECVADNGAGWYCDKNNAVNDGCGHQSFWPVCKSGPVPDAGLAVKDACVPVALYGPQPCASDSDCVTRYGAGWYCDKSNAVNDGCGHESTWPICKK